VRKSEGHRTIAGCGIEGIGRSGLEGVVRKNFDVRMSRWDKIASSSSVNSLSELLLLLPIKDDTLSSL
jgi:hypothetical protein